MPEQAQMQAVPYAATPVQIRSIQGRQYWGLKSLAREDATGARPVRFGGRDLPATVGKALPDPGRALCLGPGEWLIMSAENVDMPQVPAVEFASVDLTDSFAAFEIQGCGAQELLSKGCGLDLHPRSFVVDRCARTRFAQVSAILHRFEPTRFELYAARSYDHYLHEWLVDAAAEMAF